jgi:hypothetical protein
MPDAGRIMAAARMDDFASGAGPAGDACNLALIRPTMHRQQRRSIRRAMTDHLFGIDRRKL